MNKEQYFVHYRDDGPQNSASHGSSPADPWSCLFIFETLAQVVEWHEQEFQRLGRERANARVENRWSTRYNADPARGVFSTRATRQKRIQPLKPPRAFRARRRPGLALQ